jgi:hypothetical protein
MDEHAPQNVCLRADVQFKELIGHDSRDAKPGRGVTTARVDPAATDWFRAALRRRLSRTLVAC